jgi:hypothetical protein
MNEKKEVKTIAQGDTCVTQAQGVREARRIWQLLEDERLNSPLRTTVEVSATIKMKETQNFSPVGCVCIFFGDRGRVVISGVGKVSPELALLAIRDIISRHAIGSSERL